VPAQTQRACVQKVWPSTPLQAGYRSKKQNSTHIWLHVTSLAISFPSAMWPSCFSSLSFLSLLCHPFPSRVRTPACLFFSGLPFLATTWTLVNRATNSPYVTRPKDHFQQVLRFKYEMSPMGLCDKLVVLEVLETIGGGAKLEKVSQWKRCLWELHQAPGPHLVLFPVGHEVNSLLLYVPVTMTFCLITSPETKSQVTIDWMNPWKLWPKINLCTFKCLLPGI
jgi:hypothetical protein